MRTSSHKFFNGCLCRINLIATFNFRKKCCPAKGLQGIWNAESRFAGLLVRLEKRSRLGSHTPQAQP